MSFGGVISNVAGLPYSLTVDILTLLPEGVPLWAALLVIIAAFFTSALTAAFGLGGGLALLAVMSAVLPAPAIIPIHGAAQLGSNFGRALLQLRNAVLPIAFWFTAGGVLGALAGGRMAVEMPVWALRSGVGIFILYSVWGPRPKNFLPGVRTFFLTGMVASFLTMFFGATGPIAATMLGATKLDRLAITATHAICMVAQHAMKILIFGALGFAYGPWVWLIIAILIVGFAGTWLGTHVLNQMPEERFRRGFKFILTAIAAYLLVAAILGIG